MKKFGAFRVLRTCRVQLISSKSNYRKSETKWKFLSNAIIFPIYFSFFFFRCFFRIILSLFFILHRRMIKVFLWPLNWRISMNCFTNEISLCVWFKQFIFLFVLDCAKSARRKTNGKMKKEMCASACSERRKKKENYCLSTPGIYFKSICKMEKSLTFLISYFFFPCSCRFRSNNFPIVSSFLCGKFFTNENFCRQKEWAFCWKFPIENELSTIKRNVMNVISFFFCFVLSVASSLHWPLL